MPASADCATGPFLPPRRRAAAPLLALAALVATAGVPVSSVAAPSCLDPGFGVDGSIKTDWRLETFPEAHGVAFQSDGKIVAVGTLRGIGGASLEVALTRHHPDGALDLGFGSGGKLTTSISEDTRDEGAAVAIQAGGKIVVAGSTYDLPTGVGAFLLLRYDSSGALDPTFGSGGATITSFPGGLAAAAAMAVQSDGRLVVAGRAGTELALARYDVDGALDPTFGGGGRVTTDLGFGAGGVAEATGVAIQSDGKIVVVGGAGPAGGSGFALARFESSGALDSGFGSGGVVTTFGAGALACGLAIQGDGKIVLGGVNQAASGFTVARFGAGGAPDASFGSGGMVTTDVTAPGSATGGALVVRMDGTIAVVASGLYPTFTAGEFFDFPGYALVRYTADGAVDTAFADHGLATATGLGEPLVLRERADATLLAAGGGFRLARFDTGNCAQEIAATRLFVKDNADASRRKVVLVVADPRIDPGAPAGPDPASDGAALHIYNAAGTGESVCLGLPAASWTATGAAPTVRYAYRDTTFTNGPCQVAKLTDGHLKLRCLARVRPLDYSLDEPSQGRIAVRFSSGATTYCAAFGGAVAADSGTDPPVAGGRGRFNAKNAPPPGACPIPPAACAP